MGLYAVCVEPLWIEVTPLRIDQGSLARSMEGLRVAVVADLHMSVPGLREHRLARILRRIDPDYLFVLGDLIQYHGPYRDALAYVESLPSKRGSLVVFGDAENSNRRGSCVACHLPGSRELRPSGRVRYLMDEVAILENRGRRTAVVGAAPDTIFRGRLDERLMEKAGGLPVILLAHYPRAFDAARECGVELTLAGDTHGGQVPLPAFVQRRLFHWRDRGYLRGAFRDGPHLLYVTRGIGTSHAPVRFACRPEVVVVDFGGEGG